MTATFNLFNVIWLNNLLITSESWNTTNKDFISKSTLGNVHHMFISKNKIMLLYEMNTICNKFVSLPVNCAAIKVLYTDPSFLRQTSMAFSTCIEKYISFQNRINLCQKYMPNELVPVLYKNIRNRRKIMSTSPSILFHSWSLTLAPIPASHSPCSFPCFPISSP